MWKPPSYRYEFDTSGTLLERLRSDRSPTGQVMNKYPVTDKKFHVDTVSAVDHQGKTCYIDLDNLGDENLHNLIVCLTERDEKRKAKKALREKAIRIAATHQTKMLSSRTATVFEKVPGAVLGAVAPVADWVVNAVLEALETENIK